MKSGVMTSYLPVSKKHLTSYLEKGHMLINITDPTSKK